MPGSDRLTFVSLFLTITTKGDPGNDPGIGARAAVYHDCNIGSTGTLVSETRGIESGRNGLEVSLSE